MTLPNIHSTLIFLYIMVIWETHSILYNERIGSEGLMTLEIGMRRVQQNTCFRQCIQSDCQGFSLSLTQEPDGSRFCVLSNNQTMLPSGKWMIFTKAAYAAIPFVRRQDGSVDFYLFWDDYVSGFGDKDGEFWLGLETLHELTSSGQYKLWVGMKRWTGQTYWAEYSTFSVGDAVSKYQLTIGGFNPHSTAGDSLTNISLTANRVINGMKFSTRDSDNDLAGSQCARDCQGGWWFNACQGAKPTGRYENVGNYWRGINWYTAQPDISTHKSLKYMEMQIVPVI